MHSFFVHPSFLSFFSLQERSCLLHGQPWTAKGVQTLTHGFPEKLIISFLGIVAPLGQETQGFSVG